MSSRENTDSPSKDQIRRILGGCLLVVLIWSTLGGLLALLWGTLKVLLFVIVHLGPTEFGFYVLVVSVGWLRGERAKQKASVLDSSGVVSTQ